MALSHQLFSCQKCCQLSAMPPTKALKSKVTLISQSWYFPNRPRSLVMCMIRLVQSFDAVPTSSSYVWFIIHHTTKSMPIKIKLPYLPTVRYMFIFNTWSQNHRCLSPALIPIWALFMLFSALKFPYINRINGKLPSVTNTAWNVCCSNR